MWENTNEITRQFHVEEEVERSSVMAIPALGAINSNNTPVPEHSTAKETIQTRAGRQKTSQCFGNKNLF